MREKHPSKTIWKPIGAFRIDCVACRYSEGTYLNTQPPFPEKWWCKKHNVPADAVCTDYVTDPEVREAWGGDEPPWTESDEP
jgi:hypothetical protein